MHGTHLPVAVAALTGDIEAATHVELQLPETGGCSTRPLGSTDAEAAAPAPAACCAKAGA